MANEGYLKEVSDIIARLNDDEIYELLLESGINECPFVDEYERAEEVCESTYSTAIESAITYLMVTYKFPVLPTIDTRVA